jgi:uncharacterized protein DUF6152
MMWYIHGESKRESGIFEGIMKAYVRLGLTAALLFGPALPAHHGSANYDMSKSVSVKGTVKQFAFTNPHSAIYVEAKSEKGGVEEWLVEADSPNNLARYGWTRDSIKAGDLVTVVGNPLKDGTRVMRLQKVIFADGRELKPREGNEYEYGFVKDRAFTSIGEGMSDAKWLHGCRLCAPGGAFASGFRAAAKHE